MKKNLLLAILCMGSMLCTQAQKKIFSNIPSGQKNMTTGQQKDTRTLTNEDINHQMQVAPAVPKIYFPHIRKLNGKSTFGSEKMLDDRNTSYNIEDSKKNKPNQVLNASDPKFRNTSSTTLNGNATKVPMVYKITRDYNDGDGSKPYKGYFILTDAIDEWNPATTYWPTKKDSSFGDQGFFNCKYVKQSFTAQSSTFMNGAVNINGDNLIPGTIYSYEDLSKGNFREYTDGRNPVNIWTPVFVGNSSSPSSNQFLVQEPNGRNIMQGISNLVRTFTVNQAGAKSYQQTIYSDNLADLNMLVSAGGSYGGFSGFGISKINQTQHHIYITFDDVKLLFSVDCDRPANGYFADGKTPVASSPLVVVKNVTYCTRILANLDIATTASTNYDSLHLNYTDGVDEGTIDFSALANNNSISVTGNVMVVGTDINIPIVSARQLANFEQQLSDLFAKSNFKTALPIQYQLSDLDGNLLGIQSLTDDFVDPQCTPEKDVYTLQSAFFTLTSGGDGKNGNSLFILQVGIDDGSHVLVNGTPVGPAIGQYSDNQTEYKPGGTLPAIGIPFLNYPSHPNAYTLDEFKNGGYVYFYLSCAAEFLRSDDWDIATGTVTFNFVSQKGIPYTGKTQVKIPNFRLSSSTNGFTVGQQVIWFKPDFTSQ